LFTVMRSRPIVAWPMAPWICTKPVGAGANAEAVRVRVDVIPGPIVDGLNAAVTPGGRITADNVPVPVNPSQGCMLMVVVAVPPGLRSTKTGLANNWKPTYSVFAVRFNEVVALRLPLVPVMTIFVVITEP
jgi:hypothetical protein